MKRSNPVILHALCQPLFRKRITHRKVIEPQNCLLYLLLIGACAVAFNEMQKARCRFCVRLLQKPAHHVRLDELDLALVRNAKRGIQPNLVKIIADYKQAEGVNGRNLGIVNQRCLLLQMLTLRELL